ncbi:carboxylesterase family protein, partial [Diplocarpon rosae]
RPEAVNLLSSLLLTIHCRRASSAVVDDELLTSPSVVKRRDSNRRMLMESKARGSPPWRRLRWKTCLASLSFTTLCLWLLVFSYHGRVPPGLHFKMSRPKVELRQGSFLGVELNDGYPQVLEAFLGIPYGLSTEGLGRFRPPIRVNDSETEFDAGQYGNRCLSISGGPKQSEDCLKLDLYRPKARNPGDKLPVLVDFHGGAFNGGVGDSSWMVSHMAAWSAEPMIAVSFSYRVGAFGFLSSEIMAKEGLLNLGLKDQELLLEWVQENIAAFGGDPENVTLRGCSAGAHSIGHHLMHNTDRPPLFARAILESGATTARAVYQYSNPIHERQFQEFLKELGCPSLPRSRLVTRLRGYSAAEIQAASAKIFQKSAKSVKWPFQPVIDGPGGIIPIRPIDAWRAGKWHKVPILTGFNTNEGAMFVPKDAETNHDFTSFFADLLPGLSSKDISELAQLYPDPTKDARSQYRETRSGLGAQFRRLEQAYGHFAYTAPVRQTVHFASAGPAPVYLYHFAASSSRRGGADHGGARGPGPDARAAPGSSWCLGRGTTRWPGRGQGVAVRLKDDVYAAEESEFWWNRTELFEF